jgi:hypothetical protein
MPAGLQARSLLFLSFSPPGQFAARLGFGQTGTFVMRKGLAGKPAALGVERRLVA